MSDVLIVGAGPTGLTLAAQLHAQGVDLRIIERRRQRGPSHAFVVHPRTLEVLAGLGVASALVDAGDRAARVQLHAGGRTGSVELSVSDQEETAYPFLLFIPQASVEEVLETHLRREGVVIERGTELTGLTPGPDTVACVLHRDDGGVERTDAPYVVGCDGADSTVRRGAGIAFASRAYRPSLVLADLDVDGDLAEDQLHGFVDGPGLLFLFPSPSGARWRLLTVTPPELVTGRDGSDGPGPDELQAVVDRFTDGALRIRPPSWVSHLRLRRGQAATYRSGRVLLAGDAAHVHSPAAAQGMNTGIQDACNLAWKLALVVHGRAPSQLLDSYEAERWPVARRTRQLTDLVFALEAADHAPVRWVRAHGPPLALPLVRGRRVPTAAFALLGGLATRYRGSPIVREGNPRLRSGPRAGDRLPDRYVVDGRERRRLHEVLRRPAHHLLLCGPPDAVDRDGLGRLQQESRLPLSVHRIAQVAQEGGLLDPGGQLLRRLGVRGSALYLVRPDGYLAYRAAGSDLEGVRRYLDALGGTGELEPAARWSSTAQPGRG